MYVNKGYQALYLMCWMDLRVVGTNNHADPKVCCHKTTWAIILMTPIHLLEASGAPVFTLQQGGMITVHKGRFFSLSVVYITYQVSSTT